MEITDKKYYSEYWNLIGKNIKEMVKKFDFNKEYGNIEYQTQASAVYSSNIEGNSIDLNSFMNYKLAQKKVASNREIEEIEDLIAAYEFAQKSQLSENNFLQCHRILSRTLLTKSNRGKYRSEKVGVFGQTGLVYLAIEPEFVNDTMSDLFKQIKYLLNDFLSVEEVFYFASLIHLQFVHIHPFQDGNGRAARLLEKWFLAEKLGEDFWKIPSEKYYKDNQLEYYKNINIGVNYYELNYDDCLPFLRMLANCIK